MRDSTIIYRQLSFSQGWPVSALTTSAAGISTEPINRLHTHSSMVSMVNPTMSSVLRDMLLFLFIQKGEIVGGVFAEMCGMKYCSHVQ